MHYYKEDNSPERWAAAALAVYAIVLAVALVFGEVRAGLPPEPREVVLVDFPEPPQPVPEPPAEPVSEARQHQTSAPEERNVRTRGEAEETRTVNTRALFRQHASGPDEAADAGNPHAAHGERETASGEGSGLKPDGSDRLDSGLRGRGLAGALPAPDYPGNVAGKVVIRVTVDRGGKVTAAVYEPEGSTTSNAQLVEAARKAALEARFTESERFVQGGTITYIFKLN